jgi:hypothetical protein
VNVYLLVIVPYFALVVALSRMLKNSGKRAFPQSPTAPVRV